MSPTTASAAAAQRWKRPGGHLADLRHTWSQCAPKMVKALSTASAPDDTKNSAGVMQYLFDVVWLSVTFCTFLLSRNVCDYSCWKFARIFLVKICGSF